MAGHSKWSNIKHRKGAQDAKRGKLFTKIIKEITISSRIGGGDLSSNPRLRKAIDNAKSSNMPGENIEKAIKKGTGELEGTHYEDVVYEGFGPGGISLILEVITDNKNRTVAEIRHLLSKYGGNLGETGSVTWMFDKKGIIIINVGDCDEEEILDKIIDLDIEDFINESGLYIIETKPGKTTQISEAIKNYGYKIESTDIQLIPKVFHSVNKEESSSIINLLNDLEENDDITNFYTNFDTNV